LILRLLSIVRLALRNVARHWRRSFTIALLIAAGTALFVTGNSIFADSDRGIKASFIQSFTGDFSVSAKADEAFSLFGNEVPIVGEYATTPPLQRHDEIVAALRGTSGVKSVVSVVSGAARIDFGQWQSSAIFFGVAGHEYLRAFPSISVLQGAFLDDGQPGILLNAAQVEGYAKATGKSVVIGEQLGLTVFSDAGFTIRSVPLRGVFVYANRSAATDKICIVDAETARSLNGYIVGANGQAGGGASSSLGGGTVDDLFSSSEGDTTTAGAGLDLASVENALGRSGESDLASSVSSGAWNFPIPAASGWAPS